MDLKKPIVIVENNQVIINKQFIDEEYMLINSENKQVTIYQNGQIINGYTEINNQYVAFISPGAKMDTIIKIDTPSSGIKFDIRYKKWVID